MDRRIAVLRCFGSIPAVLAGLVLSPYLLVPWYRFPEPAPFHGSQWYNPYAHTGATWQKVNLHAHSQAWGTLTNGHDAVERVRDTYAAMGYAGIGISNYQQVASTTLRGVLPVYEHGYNAAKSHLLVVGDAQVSWFDYPLTQSVHHQQYVIDRVRARGGLVVVNHPRIRGARGTEQLTALTGYDMLEVLNHFGVAEAEWDVALSAGRPVWALGSDDTHDVTDPGQTGVMWTSVAAGSASPDSLLVALRAGRSIAVRGSRNSHGVADGQLESLTIVGNTVHVRFAGNVRQLRFIADEGRTVGVSSGRTGTYVLTANDSYVRVVATTPGTTFYLNPIIRHNGRGVLHQDATPATSIIWGLRLLLWGVLGIPVVQWMRGRFHTRRDARRKRQPLPLSQMRN